MNVMDSVNNILCQGCLGNKYNITRTDQNTNIQFKKLLQFNNDVKVPEQIYLCVYCVARVRNIHKFIDQCTHINNNYFNIFFNHNMPETNYFSLKQTEVINNMYCEDSYNFKVKIEVKNDDSNYDDKTHSDDDDDNVPLVDMKKEIVKHNMPETNDLSLKPAEVINNCEGSYNYKVKIEVNNDESKYDDRGLSDDDNDDVPLVDMKKEIVETEEIQIIYDCNNIKQEDSKVIDPEKRKPGKIKIDKLTDLPNSTKSIENKKLKKGIRRKLPKIVGYKVVKLTKEQVLEELQARAETDKFKRSPFKCEKCVVGFNFQEILDDHMKKHCEKEGSVLCEICTQYWPPGYHMRTHMTRYDCKCCGSRFSGRRCAIDHYRNKHTNENITYKCTLCSFYTSKNTSFQAHLTRHNKTVSIFSCEKCGKTLKDKGAYRDHIVSHDKESNLKCSDCNGVFSTRFLLSDHILTHHLKNESFYCIECDVTFKNRASLQAHYKKTKAHNPNVLVTHDCKLCESTFDSLALLSNHLLSIHKQDTRVTCPLCQKKYSSSAGLASHYRKQHTDYSLPIHTCHQCGRSFKGRAILERHMITHTGLRPYKCQECDASFAQNSTRYNHIRLVHRKLPRGGRKKIVKKKFKETQEFSKTDEEMFGNNQD